MQEIKEMWVWYLGREDPLEEEMATHSNILAWRIPWTEEPGGLQSIGWQRVGYNWSDLVHMPVVFAPLVGSVSCLGAGWLHLHLVLNLHTSKLSEKKGPHSSAVDLMDPQWCGGVPSPFLNQSLFAQEDDRLWLTRLGSLTMPRSAPLKPLRQG